MANDGGVWVKLEDAGSSAPGAAVINDAASNYDNKDAGVTIDGKTYDIYTFTTATTTRSMFLTDEAQARITDEDLLMAVATTPIPDDFTGDPVELFDEKYRNQLRNAFEITPAADPGLSLTVDTPGLVDLLVIGGGGGGSTSVGGVYNGGGGGGGGFLEEMDCYLPEGNVPVVVAAAARQMTTGNYSRVGPYVAYGGGRGGNSQSGGGSDGASGGGNMRAMADQGNDGSVGVGWPGGGGGAGTAASQYTGGDGKESLITGTPVSYAAGGNGLGSGENGDPNTGNGGYGGAAGTEGNKGGSGIVIVRVEI